MLAIACGALHGVNAQQKIIIDAALTCLDGDTQALKIWAPRRSGKSSALATLAATRAICTPHGKQCIVTHNVFNTIAGLARAFGALNQHVHADSAGVTHSNGARISVFDASVGTNDLVEYTVVYWDNVPGTLAQSQKTIVVTSEFTK